MNMSLSRLRTNSRASQERHYQNGCHKAQGCRELRIEIHRFKKEVRVKGPKFGTPQRAVPKKEEDGSPAKENEPKDVKKVGSVSEKAVLQAGSVSHQARYVEFSPSDIRKLIMYKLGREK